MSQLYSPRPITTSTHIESPVAEVEEGLSGTWTRFVLDLGIVAVFWLTLGSAKWYWLALMTEKMRRFIGLTGTPPLSTRDGRTRKQVKNGNATDEDLRTE